MPHRELRVQADCAPQVLDRLRPALAFAFDHAHVQQRHRQRRREAYRGLKGGHGLVIPAEADQQSPALLVAVTERGVQGDGAFDVAERVIQLPAAAVTVRDIEVKGKEIRIDREAPLHEFERLVDAARPRVRKAQRIQDFARTQRVMARLSTRLIGLLGTQYFEDRERVIDLARTEQVLGKGEPADSPNESCLFRGARVPPGKRVRRPAQCHGLARLFHPAERPERESQRAIDIRMAMVPRERFEQGYGICVFSLGHQRAGPSKGRFLVRPQGIGTLEGRHGLRGAIQVQQPSAAPEPGRRVVGIHLHRALEIVEGCLVKPVSPFQ